MKLKCKRCGNDDLHFVSVTVQDGKEDLFFTTVGSIALILAALGGLSLLVGAAATDLPGFITAPAVLLALVAPLSVAFFCFSFRKLMPYKTHDVIKYVCPHCGHRGPVKELRAAQGTPTPTARPMPEPDEKETDVFGREL